MESKQVSEKSTALDVVVALKKATSKTNVTFVSIRNYTNKYGEIANHLINVGASYSKAKERDIEFLKNLDLNSNEFEFKSDMALLIEAKQSLIESFENPSVNRSQGQIEAYTNIVDGVKVHNESGKVYVYGYRQSKTILQDGVYPVVNSKPLTKAKDEIRKLLRTSKYTQYVLDNVGEIRANGETLEL
jgi:hypothetical protein